jgi:hypothetical protein
MLRKRMLALSLLMLGSLGLGACADTSTAPVLDAPAAEGLLDPVLGLLGVGGKATVLKRSSPLATDEVVTRTIGTGGGTIYLPKSGLTLTFPSGAVASNTSITVTAPKGDLMGYYMTPHGTVFKKNVKAKQDLTKSELGLLGRLLKKPRAVYFDGPLNPIVTILELLPLNLQGLLGYATFDIKHFSGYVIATD